MPAALDLLQDLPEQGATANQWLDHKRNSESSSNKVHLTSQLHQRRQQ